MTNFDFDVQRFVAYVYGTDASETLRNTNAEALIYAYGGDDSIYNRGLSSTIYSGSGTNTVRNYNGDRSYVELGGDNRFYGYDNDFVTLISGAGNNYISLSASNSSNLIVYKGGSDTLLGYNATDTISLEGGYSTETSGKDIVISISGGGSIVLKNASGKALNIAGGEEGGGSEDKVIYGTAGNDSLNKTVTGATIYALAGNDTVWSYGDRAVIFGDAGNDYLNSWGATDVSLYGGEGDDTIRIMPSGYASAGAVGQYAYVDAGAGNDFVYNWNGSVGIYGGAGADSIYNDGHYGFAKNVTIDGGNDNDYIYNWGETALIDGGNGNDSIYNANTILLSGATLDGGNGNDYIRTWGGKTLIDGGTGNDTVMIDNYYGTASDITVYGGTGNDSIINNGTKAYVYGGTGNDTLWQNGTGTFVYVYQSGWDFIGGYNENSSISLGAGASYSTQTSGSDVVISMSGGGSLTVKEASGKTLNIVGGTVVSNSNSYVTLTTTAQADTVENHGNNVTILAGAGGDSIVNYGTAPSITSYSRGKYARIFAEGGNDYVENHGGYSLVEGGAGNDTISNSSYGEGATIRGGAGNDSVRNSGARAIVEGGDGADNLNNTDLGTNATLDGGAGNDLLTNSGASAIVKGGDGADTLTNTNLGANATLDGGDGNDRISTYNAAGVSINGGAGDDTISVLGSAAGTTVLGGTGNDVIHGSTSNSYGVVYGYQTGHGSDTIYNVNAADTISLGADLAYATQASGSDVLVSLASGSILLKNASGKAFKIAGGSTKVFNGTSGADSLDVSVAGATIYGNAGNDSIWIRGDGSKAYGGAGADRLWNYGRNVLMDGGDGDDVIDNRGNIVTVLGGAGNDYIHNDPLNGGGETVTIDGGDGDDTVNNFAGHVSIFGGAGNDSLLSHRIGFAGSTTIRAGEDVLLDGGAGNDFLYSGGRDDSNASTTLRAGSGNDTISLGSDSNHNIIVYESGADIVYGYKATDSISLSASAVYSRETLGTSVVLDVVNSGAVTIDGASGKTLNIVGGSESVTAESGEVINNTVNGAVVNGKGGDDTITNSGYNAKIYGGRGNDSIYNGVANGVSLSGGDGDDIIVNSNYNNNSLSGDAGNDTLKTAANGTTLDGGAGNDVIIVTNYYAYQTTARGGEGDDSITVYGGLVEGGAGADRISLGSPTIYSGAAYGSTVEGGTGDDTVYGNGQPRVYVFNPGDGNDVYYGVNKADTLTITGGGSYSTQASGNDVIVNVTGGGSVTLKGVKGAAPNIFPAKEEQASISPQDVILKLSAVLDTVSAAGIGAFNQAVSIASGGYFRSAEDVIDKMVEDRRSAKNTTDYLENYCGIFLNNDDTGAITGSDAGGSSEKNAADVVPESGSLKNYTSDTFTANGVTFSLGKWTSYSGWKYQQIGYNDLTTDDQRYLWKSYASYWCESGLDLIDESFGYNFNETGTTVKNITMLFINDPNDETTKASDGALAVTRWWYNTSSGKTNTLTITVNMAYYYGFGSSDQNGISPRGQIYLDRNVTHEMTHAVMAANINFYGDLPAYVKEGYCEVVHGGDFRSDDILALANDTNKLRAALNESSGYASVSGVYNPSYAGGIMFMRYFAKQAAEHYGETSGATNSTGSSESTAIGEWYSVKGAVLTVNDAVAGDRIDLSSFPASVTRVNASKIAVGLRIIGNAKADSIVSGSGNDTISGNIGNDKISGGAGDDILFGDAGNDSLSGGAGNDTLEGGSGNDTLTGGAGSDVFVYNSGSDVITDYEAGKDKIRLNYCDIAGASLKGSDVVLTVGSGTLTVKNAKGKKLTVIDKEGVETTAVYPIDNGTTVNGALLTVSTVYSGSKIDLADYPAAVTKINASALTKSVTIVGSAAANSIKGGKGADTIYGGLGKDTVSLGAGADVYVYAGGDDLIQDYTAGADKISLASASITGASLSSTNVVLKTTAGNITVKGAKNKKITVIDSRGNETTGVYPADSGVTVNGAVVTFSTVYSGSKIDLADYATNVTKVNASALTKGVTIVGSAANNSIRGGKGADTIYGGAGNDTVSLGAGADVYVYERGNDLIQDYAAADKIKLASASITGSSLSGTNVILKTTAGNITLKGAKTKQITVTDARGNTTTQKYGTSGSSALWFTADDTNFIGGEAQLSEVSAVTANDYSVGKINASNTNTANVQELPDYTARLSGR